MQSTAAAKVDVYGDVYAESWYALMRSNALKPGQVKPVEAFNQALVAFRTTTGRVVVMDRFCPHMGASLANGRVVEDRLVCPFHAWEYGPSGRCTRIPYLDKESIPKAAVNKTFPCEERYGLIWIYNGDKPAFGLPEVPEFGHPEFGLRYRQGEFACHAFTMMENGADTQHIKFVHRTNFSRYETEVTRDDPHDFEFRTTMYDCRIPFGRRPFDLRVDAHYVGGGSMLVARTHRGDRVRACLIASALPISPRRSLHHVVAMGRHLPWWLTPLEPLWQELVTYGLWGGTVDDYKPVWRDMDPTKRVALVADDKTQQRLHRAYKAHLTSRVEATAPAVSGTDTIPVDRLTQASVRADN